MYRGKMLLYSKLHEFLHREGCKVVDLMGVDNSLKYVKIQTKAGSCAIITIPPTHNMRCDLKQVTPLTLWEPRDSGFESILTTDPSIPIAKEILAESTPEGYIDFLKRLHHSVSSLCYNIGIISREYLSILTSSGGVDVYRFRNYSEKAYNY